MWFQDLVGFEESTGDEVRSRLSVEGETMVSSVNRRRMSCGTLETPTLAELRTRTDGGGGAERRLTLRQVVGDVGSLHRDPANSGAMFQAASQFNLLEMTSPDVTPEQGVDRYENDPTQGPACAVACGAGTIFRNYFVEVEGGIGQAADRQIDCLADMGQFLFPDGDAPWRMRNGYALFNGDGLDGDGLDGGGLERVNDRIGNLTASEFVNAEGHLRIGVHRNVEVTTSSSGHTVSQAYCAALPIGYHPAMSGYWEPFAKLVLDATYEATLRAAAINAAATENRTVFLTMVGGGIFGNHESWILDAIRRACDATLHLDLDVVIVKFRKSTRAVTALVESFRE